MLFIQVYVKNKCTKKKINEVLVVLTKTLQSIQFLFFFLEEKIQCCFSFPSNSITAATVMSPENVAFSPFGTYIAGSICDGFASKSDFSSRPCNWKLPIASSNVVLPLSLSPISVNIPAPAGVRSIRACSTQRKFLISKERKRIS